MRISLTTAVSTLVFIDGLIWLIGVIPTLYYAFTRRDLPTLAGIRLMSGPFEALGIEFLIATGIMYVMVSGLKLLAAYWLWHGRLDGAVLALVLLGLSAIFWYGFGLPLGPLLGVVQVVLLALVWSSLR